MRTLNEHELNEILTTDPKATGTHTVCFLKSEKTNDAAQNAYPALTLRAPSGSLYELDFPTHFLFICSEAAKNAVEQSIQAQGLQTAQKYAPLLDAPVSFIEAVQPTYLLISKNERYYGLELDVGDVIIASDQSFDNPKTGRTDAIFEVIDAQTFRLFERTDQNGIVRIPHVGPLANLIDNDLFCDPNTQSAHFHHALQIFEIESRAIAVNFMRDLILSGEPYDSIRFAANMAQICESFGNGASYYTNYASIAFSDLMNNDPTFEVELIEKGVPFAMMAIEDWANDTMRLFKEQEYWGRASLPDLFNMATSAKNCNPVTHYCNNRNDTLYMALREKLHPEMVEMADAKYSGMFSIVARHKALSNIEKALPLSLQL